VIFLVLWMMVTFVGFSMQLLFTGSAVVDHAWFKRLSFREDTIEIAWTHVVVAYFFDGILGILLFVGLVAYLSTPPGPPPPVTLPRIVSSVGFIMAAAGIVTLSAYMRWRRAALMRREERRQMAELEAMAAAPGVPVDPTKAVWSRPEGGN
jgi:hypothetical protein